MVAARYQGAVQLALFPGHPMQGIDVRADRNNGNYLLIRLDQQTLHVPSFAGVQGTAGIDGASASLPAQSTHPCALNDVEFC